MESNLVKSALKNKDIILNIIKKFPYENKCKIDWRELPEKGEMVEYSAEDGGDVVSEFETFTIYAVKSYSKIFSNANDKGKPEEKAFFGLLLPPKYSMSRVSLYREILEASSSLNSIPKNGMFLFDGSIVPIIAWWRPLSSIKNGYMLNSLIDLAKEKMQENEENIRDINELISDKVEHPIMPELLMKRALNGYSLDDSDWYLALEILEKLYSYKVLIEKIWENNSIPVFITKTSRSRDFCKSNLPDVHIIRRAEPSNPGYLIWEDSIRYGSYNITGERKGDKMFPNIGNISDFFERRLGVLKLYARLSRGGSILQIEFLLDNEKNMPNYESLTEELLSKLISISLQKGYPTSLVLAHHYATITYNDMESLIKISGLEGEVRERTMLYF
ncbi:MAG: DNA double-strand break repair nuclease NurA [Caldisphaera sp.]|jgi:NurA-like 5'-3' nuclease|uniref:DNA double-strand break repair nuclease NurA n=1 Tax=Caldisphaera sp. TaxID=2060322 RepID=UPI003979A9D0